MDREMFSAGECITSIGGWDDTLFEPIQYLCCPILHWLHSFFVTQIPSNYRFNTKSNEILESIAETFAVLPKNVITPSQMANKSNSVQYHWQRFYGT
jgi:hypothetical protein